MPYKYRLQWRGYDEPETVLKEEKIVGTIDALLNEIERDLVKWHNSIKLLYFIITLPHDCEMGLYGHELADALAQKRKTDAANLVSGKFGYE